MLFGRGASEMERNGWIDISISGKQKQEHSTRNSGYSGAWYSMRHPGMFSRIKSALWIIEKLKFGAKVRKFAEMPKKCLKNSQKASKYNRTIPKALKT